MRVYDALLHDRDEHGDLRPKGWLYEMGIPVCPTGDPWDVEIMQKVPVNLERNSVSEAYLRSVRVFTLNHMHDRLRPEDAATPAVQDALTDKRIEKAAVETVLIHQYGAKRAIYDPSDTEANHRLVAEGFKIIHGGAYSKEAWENIRISDAARPSGQILPTPKPYSEDPNAPMRELLPESEWTPGMRNVADYAIALGQRLMGAKIRVLIDKGGMNGHAACYGMGELTFALKTLGRAYFDRGATESLNQLLIHEFAHHYGDSHLGDDFHKGLEKMGARMVTVALTEPELFKRHGWKEEAER